MGREGGNERARASERGREIDSPEFLTVWAIAASALCDHLNSTADLAR